MNDFEMVNQIHQCGSFSKAAEALYVSQSSLSMAIQRLEGELGVPLIDRHQRPIRLTEAGMEYLRYYHQIKPLETDMRAKIRDISELKGGTLSLGGTHYLLSFILPEAITSFAYRYPDITLRIVEAPSAAFNNLLLDCKIDLCLKCDIKDTRIQSLSHAFFDELFLAVPKTLVEENNFTSNWLTADDISAGQIVPSQHYFHIDDFEKISFLQLRSGNNLYARSEKIFETLGIKPKRIIQFEQFATAYSLAAAGLGCTLTSSRIIQKQASESLVYYCLPSPLMIRDFHFATRKNAYVSNSVRAFCELFTKIEGKHNQTYLPSYGNSQS